MKKAYVKHKEFSLINFLLRAVSEDRIHHLADKYFLKYSQMQTETGFEHPPEKGSFMQRTEKLTYSHCVLSKCTVTHPLRRAHIHTHTYTSSQTCYYASLTLCFVLILRLLILFILCPVLYNTRMSGVWSF